MGVITKGTRGELVMALKERYGRSSKLEKSRILEEFVAVSGCHRKHAIRLLNQQKQTEFPVMGCRRIYDEAVKAALILLWEAADRICGKRLKAILPILIVSMEKRGHLNLAPTNWYMAAIARA